MTPTNPDDDDDYELELEAVDPEVNAHARKRAERQVEETEHRAAMLDTFEAPSEADTISLDEFKNFRFTTWHLLVTTAVVAVVLSLGRVAGCNGLFFAGFAFIAYGWWWVLRRERRERLERERRRQEIDAKLAAARKTADGASIASTVRMAGLEPAVEEEPSPPSRGFSFSFSLKQILGAFAVAAVILTLATLFGADKASLILGVIAVLGLAIQVMGFELPGIVVFCWWILLLLYILMSVGAMFSSTQ